MRAFLALDFPTSREALAQLRRLGGARCGVKVGLELFTAAGPPLVRRLKADGVFLDLKVHDIPHTMEGAARSAAELGADLLTVHATAGPRGVAAAVAGARGSGTQILAVTVLTSEGGDVAGRVLRLARESAAAGAHGLVMSVEAARAARRAVGPGLLLVTPGIRFADGVAHDQARVATPGVAGREGADAMVLGRAVFGAADPAAALARALAQFRSGRRGRV
ncbi:MAG: orotidine-5'-phosphate decarboxylase [Candidatus Eisenbacteria bacterium]|nr:orotidine-5'-phosphate decarboxylase [Candidatus Eisenbacteria bacterium]